ncbi:MAG: hypothetical protein GKR94_24495 [Gammaproteobacteria bacterium]|nr:hypothetical protein [Gammaproteobacteria bacterium]
MVSETAGTDGADVFELTRPSISTLCSVSRKLYTRVSATRPEIDQVTALVAAASFDGPAAHGHLTLPVTVSVQQRNFRAPLKIVIFS